MGKLRRQGGFKVLNWASIIFKVIPELNLWF
jgi:hypothetical protein